MFKVRWIRSRDAELAPTQVGDFRNNNQRVTSGLQAHVSTLLRKRHLPGLQRNRQIGLIDPAAPELCGDQPTPDDLGAACEVAGERRRAAIPSKAA